ncbi:MAG: hypothetical protein JSS75_09345 [Bacteroidetes bacterium]|nr:hypothetical protein [Bacteroidota bacterium]
MKRSLSITLVALLAATCAYSQPQDSQSVRNIAAFCKCWGFLKYYHPAVADGKVLWDEQFVKTYDRIRSARTRKECNDVLISLYKSAESARDVWADQPSVEEFDSSAVVSKPDLSWIFDTTLFTPEVTTLMRNVKEAFRPLANRYVTAYRGAMNPDVSIDDKYFGPSEPLYPTEAIRILALARYWNIIQYYDPNRALIGRPWDSVLFDYIPRFSQAQDSIQYLYTVLQLRGELHDSHAFVRSPIDKYVFGDGYLPIRLMYLNSQTVIVGSFGSSMARFDSSLASLGLHRGDLLMKIGGVNVAELRERLRHYVGGSNEAAIERDINNYLLRGKVGDSIRLTIDNGEKEFEVTAHYQTELRASDVRTNLLSNEWSILQGNIGYVDMGQLERRNVRTMMKSLMSLPAIIFDVRNYPRGTMYDIMAYLSKRVPFAFFTRPVVSHPGYLVSTAKQMMVCGDDRGDKYKGKIIILANELTQSHAEFTIMSLQTRLDAITIGSQTAGADGNISEIRLPGNITTFFTGLGVFYSGGLPTQQIGIKINIPVVPTIAGIREGRDEVLERAVRYALSGK